jgi:hypothetical protein
VVQGQLMPDLDIGRLLSQASKARPRAGPKKKSDSRVISVSALSRMPITTTSPVDPNNLQRRQRVISESL